MGELVIRIEDDRESDGPAMSCLTEQQRAFVLVLTTTVGKDGDADPCRAAAATGYVKEAGYRLMRNPRILAAAREEAEKRLYSASLLGINGLIDIAKNPTHKDRFQALKHLAKLNGFVEVQKVEVEHKTEGQTEMVARVIANAKALGLDPRELLGQVGVVIDAEFTVVEPAAVIVDMAAEDWTV